MLPLYKASDLSEAQISRFRPKCFLFDCLQTQQNMKAERHFMIVFCDRELERPGSTFIFGHLVFLHPLSCDYLKESCFDIWMSDLPKVGQITNLRPKSIHTGLAYMNQEKFLIIHNQLSLDKIHSIFSVFQFLCIWSASEHLCDLTLLSYISFLVLKVSVNSTINKHCFNHRKVLLEFEQI